MKKKNSDFHHGHLRVALLDAAIEILDESGPDAITIREVARRSGVSHAAPVNHFKSRTALLTVVATHMFRDLASAITEKLENCVDTPSVRASIFARTLIAYGLENPARYQLLWRRDLVDNSDTELQAAMDSIYDKLISTIALSKNQQHFDEHTIAVAIWSLAHGYVSMRLDQNFELQIDSVTGQERPDAIVDAVISSLGI